MKFLLKFSLVSLSLIVLGLGALFCFPQIVLNNYVLTKVLDNVEAVQDWSWEQAHFSHQWKAWNEREFSAQLEEFCLELNNESLNYESCFPSIKYSIDIKWSPGEGVSSSENSYVKVLSDFTNLKLLKRQTKEQKTESSTIDPYGLYSMLWNDLWPSVEVELRDIELTLDKGQYKTNFNLRKSTSDLKAQAFEVSLVADPQGFKVSTPKDYSVPVEVEGVQTIVVSSASIVGEMSEHGLDVDLGIKSSEVEGRVRSYVEFPLETNTLLKDIALSTKAKLKVRDVQKSLKQIVKAPYAQLPAPINAMDGSVTIDIWAKETLTQSAIEVLGDVSVDFSGAEQELDFIVSGKTFLNLESMEPGAMFVGLEFNRVNIQLPQMPKTSLPPQLTPDSRIFTERLKLKKELAQRQQEQKTLDMEMVIDAKGPNALNFESNLIDEIIKLNLDIKVKDAALKKGVVEVLPMTTTIFRRKIKIENLVINLSENREPELQAIIKFILPEYTITMDLEGVASAPRYALSSKPPLPQSDILAVLLFGRPMSELDGADQDATTRTNQLLSQGILSLSVLYFFAGSPIEAIVYDPDSKEVEAQVGLSSKASLNIGGRSKGVSSVGVRYSLGGGWYIDTSARDYEESTTSSARDYGVLIERILSY